MSEYAITWGVEPGEIDEISGEVRDELLGEVASAVGEPLEMKHAPRQLSGDLEGIITVGTIFASNPDQLMLLYRTVKEFPGGDVLKLAFTGDDKYVFESPIDVDVDVRIGFNPEVDVNGTLIGEYKGTRIYESEEYHEALRERDRRELLKKINEQSENEYTYEEFFEEDGF